MRSQTEQVVKRQKEVEGPEAATENQSFENGQWLRMLIDSAEDYAIFTINPGGRIATWNRGAEKVFGYRREEILGQSFSIIFSPEDREKGAPEEEIRRAQEEGYSPDERWHLRKDGSQFFVSGAVRPLRSSEGDVVGFLKVAHDITERKKLEDELRDGRDHLEKLVSERTAQLQATVSELEVFSCSMSHDLRAPLRAMNGLANMLAEDFGERLGPEGLALANQIIDGARRMDELIQGVLAFGRVGREEIALGAVDLEVLVRRVIQQTLEFQPPHAEVTIAGPLRKVLGYEPLLSQVVFNLLQNAVKFVAPGVQPKVQISTEADDKMVRIWVEDNGIGIKRDHQERIFEMFQRLHTQDTYPGTGVGLAIVRKAAEKMGGRAGVESESGKGSRFWLELPAVESNGSIERRPEHGAI